jgi:trehalose 6-phosphate synthase/phosphatase
MKLIIVSNRLPVRMVQQEDGSLDVTPSSGGLVTAMTPILQRRGGLWIGWPGAGGAEGHELAGPLSELATKTGYAFEPVALSPEEHDAYYLGFSNEILWPLFHDLQSRANFEGSYWDAYQHVNSKFAEAIVSVAEPDDMVWIHDYHLMLVASELKKLGYRGRTEFFLHTPFPPADIFAKLPWRSEILESLLEHDAVGFQAGRDKENYLQCVAHFVPDASVSEDGRLSLVRTSDREACVGAFPISIDYDHFVEMASTETAEQEVRRLWQRFEGRHLILGVDRLDYTKGIPHRLRAFGHLLEAFPELHGKVTLIQLVVPSRDIIPEYANLKSEIDQLVGEINGAYTRAGWVPIHYMFRSLPQPELVALYRLADTMLVTPLKDGMNLVAKEYCASNLEGRGCLILSEFAGAAEQMQDHALMVNPYDTAGVAEAMYRAYYMKEDERRERMGGLRASIREEDIFWWVDAFMEAAERVQARL